MKPEVIAQADASKGRLVYSGLCAVCHKLYGEGAAIAPDLTGSDVVIVWRGVNRESYSCAPECSPRITLGDNAPYFASTLARKATASAHGRRRSVSSAMP